MENTFWWPTDYFASRNKFLDTAKSTGAQTRTHAITPTGPENEPLSVEVAERISEQDDHRIVLISGVHGVEGFIGAGLQIQALQHSMQSELALGVGIVMIHAANPWGFAHLRRVDEHNIDINRNFIDFAAHTPSSHSDYAVLDPIINPQKKPTLIGDLHYWARASKMIVKHKGIKKLAEPIARGQYDFPHGLFFGGHQTSPSTSLLRKLILHYATGCDRVSVLDVHTGLGPSAVATLIANTNMNLNHTTSAGLHAHYQQPIIMDDAQGNAYSAQGSLSQWCSQALNKKRYLYLCVEIGTVSPISLFAALRRENQAHHWASKDGKCYLDTKKALSAVFAPVSAQWKRRAIMQGLHVLDKTVAL